MLQVDAGFPPPHPTLSAGDPHGDSTSDESVSIPRNVSTPRFSADPQDRASTEATCGLTRVNGCLGIDGPVDDTTKGTFDSIFNANPHGYPTSQHMVLFWGI